MWSRPRRSSCPTECRTSAESLPHGGQTILRGKEWRSDSVSFSGGMMVWILYAPEDGSEERCIDGWIPFQDEVGSCPNGAEGGDHPHPVPDPVRGRPVGIRPEADGACGRSGYGGGLCAEDCGNRRPGGTNRGRGAADKQLPGQNAPERPGEKAFALDEELTLPESSPLPEKLVYYCLHPEYGEKVLSTRWCSGETGTCTCFTVRRRGSSTDGILSCLFPAGRPFRGTQRRRTGGHPAKSHQFGAGSGRRGTYAPEMRHCGAVSHL